MREREGKGRRRVTCKSRGHNWSQLYRPVIDLKTGAPSGLEFRYCIRCHKVVWGID